MGDESASDKGWKELERHKICNVTQLIELLNVPQSTVSQHLSKMRGKDSEFRKKRIKDVLSYCEFQSMSDC